MKLLIIAILLMATNVLAYDFDRALSNLSNEFANCASFYFVLSEAVKTTSDDSASEKFITIGTETANFAILSSNQKVLEARLKMAMEDMSKEIDYDYSNTAILMSKYLEPCKELKEKPFHRLKYWLDKK